MHELLAQLTIISLPVFVAVSIFNLGLDLTVPKIVDPLRNRAMLFRSLSVNILLIPLLAFVLLLFIPLDESVQIGFLLYACCLGSEAAPKFVQVAKGNPALAIGLLVVFLSVTIVVLPLVLAQVFPNMHIDQSILAFKLLLVVALPLVIGLIIRANNESLAEVLSGKTHLLSSALLLLVFTLVIYANAEQIMMLDSIILFTGLTFFILSAAIGYLSGGPLAANRRTLAIMTTARGGSVSMMIAGQAFPHDPGVLVIATLMTVLSVVLVVPASFICRRFTI